MDIDGEQTIAASRTRVWEALNDPQVLKACIPGCEAMEPDGDGRYSAAIVAKIGPVKARFTTGIYIEDAIAPESYTLVGDGKGGAAGFARGTAAVRLDEVEGGTLLHYTAAIHPGGKLAQMGSRLLVGTVRKLTEDFFSRFAVMVEGDESRPT